MELTATATNTNLEVKATKSFKCGVCQKLLSSRETLKIHLETVHENKKDFECDTCNKKFYTKRVLSQHIKMVHMRKRENQCPACPKKFSKKAYLRAHLKYKHKDFKGDFRCEECERSFIGERDLARHNSRVHGIEIPDEVECKDCQRKFTRLWTLQRHRETVHLRPKKHKCGLCEFGSNKKVTMALHVRSVHKKRKKEKEAKCHWCDDCGKRFYKEKNLQEHVATAHAGKGKCHWCDVCDQRFYKEKTLKEHIKRGHDSKKKGHWCNVCNQRFYKESTLKAHVEKSHDSRELFQCGYCYLPFVLKFALIRHMRQDHEKEFKEESIDTLNIKSVIIKDVKEFHVKEEFAEIDSNVIQAKSEPHDIKEEAFSL